MTRHRGVEGVEPLAAARLVERPREQADPAVAVLDEVVDEAVDPVGVVEQDAALAGAGQDAVEEDARSPAPGHELLEALGRDPDGREQEPVDLVVQERPQRGELAVRALARVHQHHAVAGLLERGLRALERGGVERARHVGDDEADRPRRAGAERAREERRLELEHAGRLDHRGARLVRQLAPPVERARRRRRGHSRVLGDVRERHLSTFAQSVAQGLRDAPTLTRATVRPSSKPGPQQHVRGGDHALLGADRRILVLDRDRLDSARRERRDERAPPVESWPRPGTANVHGASGSVAVQRWSRSPFTASGPGLRTASFAWALPTRGTASSTARGSICCQKRWLGSRFTAMFGPSSANRRNVSTLCAPVPGWSSMQISSSGCSARANALSSSQYGRSSALPLPLVDACEVRKPASRVEVRGRVAGSPGRAAHHRHDPVDPEPGAEPHGVAQGTVVGGSGLEGVERVTGDVQGADPEAARRDRAEPALARARSSSSSSTGQWGRGAKPPTPTSSAVISGHRPARKSMISSSVQSGNVSSRSPILTGATVAITSRHETSSGADHLPARSSGAAGGAGPEVTV